MEELARHHVIKPVVTQGHIGDVLPDKIDYDAQTTSGGSGGLLFNDQGQIIGINFAMVREFGGSNFAIPVRFGESPLKRICYIAAAIAEPGVILHTGTMQRLVFGEYGSGKSERGKVFLKACRQAGIDAEFSDEIEQRIWEKFVFLVGLSGMTSIVRQPIGPIRQNAQARSLLLDTMREVVAVGRAKGVPLAADFAENRLAFCDTLPATMTSSMQTDLKRGKWLELPWLSGSVVELGAAVGVSTPVNRVISDALALYANG